MAFCRNRMTSGCHRPKNGSLFLAHCGCYDCRVNRSSVQCGRMGKHQHRAMAMGFLVETKNPIRVFSSFLRGRARRSGRGGGEKPARVVTFLRDHSYVRSKVKNPAPGRYQKHTKRSTSRTPGTRVNTKIRTCGLGRCLVLTRALFRVGRPETCVNRVFSRWKNFLVRQMWAANTRQRPGRRVRKVTNPISCWICFYTYKNP